MFDYCQIYCLVAIDTSTPYKFCPECKPHTQALQQPTKATIHQLKQTIEAFGIQQENTHVIEKAELIKSINDWKDQTEEEKEWGIQQYRRTTLAYKKIVDSRAEKANDTNLRQANSKKSPFNLFQSSKHKSPPKSKVVPRFQFASQSNPGPSSGPAPSMFESFVSHPPQSYTSTESPFASFTSSPFAFSGFSQASSGSQFKPPSSNGTGDASKQTSPFSFSGANKNTSTSQDRPFRFPADPTFTSSMPGTNTSRASEVPLNSSGTRDRSNDIPNNPFPRFETTDQFRERQPFTNASNNSSSSHFNTTSPRPPFTENTQARPSRAETATSFGGSTVITPIGILSIEQIHNEHIDIAKLSTYQLIHLLSINNIPNSENVEKHHLMEAAYKLLNSFRSAQRTPAPTPTTRPQASFQAAGSTSVPARNEVDESYACKICFEQETNCVFLECGHSCACLPW